MAIEVEMMGQAIRGMLAVMFDTEESRIDVRVTLAPAEGDTVRTRIEVDLDGKTPPREWCEQIEALVALAAEASNAVQPGAVLSVTTGTTEDGPRWREAGN